MNYKNAEYIIDASITGSSDKATGGRVILDCQGMSVATVQAEDEGATAWSTAVLTLYRANRKEDGQLFALETAITLTANSVSAALDVSAFRYLVVGVTTAQSSLSIRINMYAQE
jgi:hypothetical protein